MTAEIVVMNKGAIAMAADSAVTVRTGEAGKVRKVFNTANKIFALSKYHPVGVMIYGNAEFMGVPWETLVKVFRKKLGRSSYRKLDGYADALNKFLKELISEQQQTEYFSVVVRDFFLLLRETLLDEMEHAFSEKEELSADQVEQATAIQVSAIYDVFKDSPFVDSVSASSHKMLKARYRDQLRKLRKEVFEELSISLAVIRQLNEIAISVFTRKKKFPSGDISGIVIAGYGDDDVFPRLTSFEFQAVLGGRLLYERGKSVDIDATGLTAEVIPFAQHEMVWRFMEGVDPQYLLQAQGYLSQMWPESLEEAIDGIAELNEGQKKRYKAVAKRVGQKAFDAYQQWLWEYRQQDYVRPVMQIVHSLPKEELAEMAESLVSLTSLKRKVTTEEETVGGPIDVAVITKGDGLVWIKRKHYFSPELNPQFFATYNLDKEQEYKDGEE